MKPYLLLLALWAPISWSNPAAYLNVNQERAPYIWKLADGTLLKKGLSDKQGNVPLTEKEGETLYALEMMYGEFKLHIPNKCWSVQNNQEFGSCITISPREDTESQKLQQKQLEQTNKEESTARKASTSWVTKTLNAEQQLHTLEQAFIKHKELIPSFGDLSKTTFSCKKLTLPQPSAQALQAFEEASNLPSGSEQTIAYAKAAKLGSWRAAARLASIALENEIWEDAKPSIAWLLHHKIPAGHNKLADLLATAGGYDGEQLSTEDQFTVITLRLRAAQQGDPVAQINMARYFKKQGQLDLAQSFQDCAKQQNPDLK
ncbi:hypothetical protein [Iodobacter ciconiae]|uniref:Uncharacterized protein n=1 Tax=Iodobacter ciconiae TaxID=2496266 RepID=A0A3S8ZQ07_9NEIS|nr:hypothetical protein [Iodobacter ciconiae]AZN35532.1 hypothetical protein EJO50_02930 [Iodobacter ciconiae]